MTFRLSAISVAVIANTFVCSLLVTAVAAQDVTTSGHLEKFLSWNTVQYHRGTASKDDFASGVPTNSETI